nr:MAG TPA: hypothetical protein [Caudoviricetes sp.]
MRLPCHTVGRASVSRSDMALRCDLQGAVGQLLHGHRVVLQGVHGSTGVCQLEHGVCGVPVTCLVHPFHHPGGSGLREAHRLAVDDAARRLGALLCFLLRPALLPVHGLLRLGDAVGVALLLGVHGGKQLVHRVVNGRGVVLVQAQTVGRTGTQHLVKAVHDETRLCTHMVADAHPAAPELLKLGFSGTLHLFVGRFQPLNVVGVQRRKIKCLSTNNHILAPFVGPCSGAAPEKPVSRHKKSPLRAERGKLRGKSASGGGIVELVRGANALDVAGKGGRRTGGAAHVAGHDQGAGALLALAGAQTEIDVRYNDIAAGAVLDLVGEQEILERIADAAVAVDRQGALGGALGVGGAGADEGVGVGGGVQRTAVLLDVVGADDPGVFLGLLVALGLDGKDKVICRLNAGIGRAGRDAGLGNGFCYGHSKTPFIWADNRSGAAASASGSCPRCW